MEPRLGEGAMDKGMIRRIFPIVAGTYIAMIPMEVAPFVIGAAVERGLSAGQAGWVGTATIAFVAIASICAPPLIARLRFRQAMIGFACIEAAGYCGFAAAQGFALLLAMGSLAGCGAGGLLAGMAIRIARTDDPDRTYGYVYAATGLGFALLLFLFPIIGAKFGTAAMFLFAGFIALALSCLLRSLPAGFLHEEVEAGPAQPVDRWGVALLVAAMIVAMPVYGGTYGFSERKAVEIGLSSRDAGLALSCAMLMSIIGSSIVALVGTQRGRLLPMATVLLLASLAYLTVLGARSAPVYVAGTLIFGLMQLALTSYFFGLASALDRNGGVAARLQGFSLIPYGLGTGLFGSLADGGSLARLAVPAAAANLVALAIVLPVLVRQDRGRRA